jgi:hypothetical protein
VKTGRKIGSTTFLACIEHWCYVLTHLTFQASGANGMVRKTGVFLSKQRAKPNRTPQHTPGHSAHPEIARSSPPCATRLSSAGARVSAGGGGTVRCSPILPKAPAITDIHRDPNPPQTDRSRVRRLRLREGARQPDACAAAWWRAPAAQ